MSRFIIADVFTATPFGGNQLAVFPDAHGLSDGTMQAFAREFNFAETTFVLPPQDQRNTRRVRIFTPKREIPFAGHPTIGTAAVLARLGLIDLIEGTGTVIFEEGAGPVAVEVSLDGAAVFSRLVLERQVDHPPTRPTRAGAAATLSLAEQAVLNAWYASAGLPFCFIHVRDKDDVDRASLDRAAWSVNFAEAWASSLFFFAGDLHPRRHLYARMFGPAYGIAEDPATGSAAAALAGYLAERLADLEGSFVWHIDQGVAMGRPSLIEMSAEKQQGRIVSIKVGGFTVLVGEGGMTAQAE